MIQLTTTALVSFMVISGLYDTDLLESGLLYRTRMDMRLPSQFLQVTLVPIPTEFRPRKQRLVRVLLLDNDRKTVLQDMRVDRDFGLDGSSAEQGDFNFDGYRDFRSFLWEASGTGGRLFVHFLYDPKTRRYVRCPQLDALPSPYPDYEEKVITSYGRGGGMYSRAQKHRWDEGKLLLISEVWRDKDEKGYFTEYSTFRGGKKIKSRRFYLHD